ncbi:MAG TPA: glycosyltransferase [Candidatus Dormibacteraeota bacterium]|jgi:starch synthase|nr:glycosyltransferase [Candidatus Dormibacteraeota bacterium]
MPAVEPVLMKFARKGSRLKNVWMFSHECSGIAQAGGLGEAVAGLANTLGSDYGIHVTVFLPSHGKHLDPLVRESYSLTDDPTFIAQGYRIGVNGRNYPFLSGVEKGHRGAVNYVLVKGLDSQTSRWLDDTTLYGHDLTFEKMALFSRTVKLYSEYLLSMGRVSEIPDLVHANDWHMVPAGVATKQHLRRRGIDVPLVFTVHLLSYTALPWHYASDQWCGIQDLPQRIRLDTSKPRNLTCRQAWEVYSQDSIEKFGCLEADYVTSVSESYLTHDVIKYVGEAIQRKSGHIYNGCDWDSDAITARVLTETGDDTKNAERSPAPARWELRKSLLTQGIAQAANDGQGIVEPFKNDGPLVLMTGRLSPQKGADVLLNAVPRVTKALPTTKFLLFLLYSGDDFQKNTIEKQASAYPNNVRLIFGKHPEPYLMAHVAADVYAMPSRSEPFGISALEAMVTGNPVVGSNIGGIRETVLDIRSHGESGTGLLIPAEDPKALADSLISLLIVMRINELAQREEPEPASLSEKIPVEHLGQLASREPRLGSKIRDNCRNRVIKNFRWKNAGAMALKRYGAAVQLVDASPRVRKGRRG